MEGGARGVSEAVEQTSAITYCWIGKGTRVHAAHSLDSITTHACTALAAQVQAKVTAEGVQCSPLPGAWGHATCVRHANGTVFGAISARPLGDAEGIAFLQALVSSCESELATCDADALPAIRAIFVLRDAMARHNSRSRLSAVQAQLSGVRAILATNIDRVLERGESLDAVVARTDDLRDHANVFRTRSRALRRRFWWRSVRMALAAVLLLLLLAFLIFLAACRGFKCIH